MELSGPQPQVKLIDLGCAAEGAGCAGREVLPPAPAQLEFAPPECVLGRPPAPAWDAWAAGVFLYVFLTGVSMLCSTAGSIVRAKSDGDGGHESNKHYATAACVHSGGPYVTGDCIC